MPAFRPRVEALTAELLGQLAHQDQPADLNTALALPLPILVICELLGVPYEDRVRFRTWTQAAADVLDRTRSEQGLAELFQYGKELVAHKRREPGDDVISRLCATDGVGDDEIAMLAMALLFAGHETTVVQIGLGALLLLSHPDQWQTTAESPDRIPDAVEEILRAPGKGGGGIPRYARTNFDIGGVTIQAGDLVMPDNGAANHDPAVFPDPDRFDITRRAASHLSDQVIATVVEHASRITSPLAAVPIYQLGGAVGRVPATDTAFGSRHAGHNINMFGAWEPGRDDRERHVSWVRDFSEAMAPYSVGQYVNFLNDEGRDGVRAAYGERWQRLVALKRRLDPQNLFRYNFNIDPGPPGEGDT